MKNVLYILFIFSAIAPAIVLTFLTLGVLPTLILDFDFSLKGILLILSCIFCLCGFAGLILLMPGPIPRLYSINIFLLILGISGFVLFNIIEGGQKAWKWILTIEEPGEWFIYVWPNIVSLTFIIVLYRKILVNRKSKD
ncbi:MAG TPA: hypothetical protein VNS32_09295 [Flavisolibacter sp.]|nr:hypothetical protein [Flavisolibacter sp.]